MTPSGSVKVPPGRIVATPAAIGTASPLDIAAELRLELLDIEPIHVAAYIRRHPGTPPAVKQHLAAIRMLFDWLVTGQVLAMNLVASVRSPKHVVKREKPPVLDADQARQLLDSIDTAKLSGLRDRALIAVMVFSFARVSAAVSLKTEDYYQDGKRWWFRFREMGWTQHQVPAHHTAEAYLDAYLFAAGVADDKKAPLVRSITRHGLLSDRQMTRNDAFRMVKRRAAAAGCRSPPATTPFGPPASRHTWRTAAPSRRPRPLPPTSRRGRPNSTTEPATKSPPTGSNGF